MRPRELVFGGRVVASALWIDAALIGEAEARRRVLALCGSGATVNRIAGGYLVRFVGPRPVDADACEGTPIVADGSTWSAAPLRPSERCCGDLLLVRGGKVEPHARDDDPVDLADWIDVSEWSVETTVAAGPTPRPGREPTLIVGSEPTSAREILGAAAPEPDPMREEILAALRPSTEASSRPPARSPGLLARMLSRLFSGGGAQPTMDSLPAGPETAAEPSAPGWLEKLLRGIVLGSPLARVIGRKQANYIERTLELLENGEWDEALRRAIPFGSLPGAPLPPSITVPSPRADLSLQATPGGGATSSIGFDPEAYARVKQLYGKAARELEAAGRYEEAAFVLFELLADNDEGVAMLERNERYALAARMAQGRDMAAGLVIRLWFLAGEPAHGILVARRTGAFADAVSRLERSHPEEAKALRLLWADRLAAGGDYAAAVTAVWPTGATPLAWTWLERAIEFGGAPACWMLVKKLELWRDNPDVVEQTRERIAAIVHDDGVSDLRVELAWALAAMRKPRPSTVAPLARQLTRRLMLDARDVDVTRVRPELPHLADDPVLSFDVAWPSTPDAAPARHSTVFEATDRGLLAPTDAVALANGRVLLALGEAGSRVVDWRGRTLVEYQAPAHRLVLADSGSRAISLAVRGKTTVLRRFDLATGRSEAWCDARFALHADSYDGALWFLATDDAVAAVDAQSEGFDALFRVGGLPGRPVAIARNATWLAFAVMHTGPASLEVWRYQIDSGGPVLRERVDVELPVVEDAWSVSLDPEGGVVACAGDVLVCSSPTRTTTQSRLSVRPPALARSDDVLAVVPVDDAVAVHRFEYSGAPGADVLMLHGAGAVRLHRCAQKVVVVDDRGRLVELDATLAIARWTRV